MTLRATSKLVCGSVLLLTAAATGQATQEHDRSPVPHKLAFVTSIEGTAVLGSWSGAGGNSGVAAGDAICQSLATTAGLPDPGSFVAWLSTSTTDAYCRLHGLTGTVAGSCGEASLPAAAGPWVRVDGVPFAERIELAVGASGRILSPLSVDELGGGVESLAFTATDGSGVLDTEYGTCDDWTSTSGLVSLGDTLRTSASWTDGSGSFCAASFRIACLQTGVGRPLPHHATGGAQAFVTSVGGSGDLSQWPGAGGLGGIGAGDAVCRTQAAAAGLPRPDSFLAWLSVSDFGLGDAIDRFTHQGPWVRVDGMLVAATRAELTSGALRVPIAVDADGSYYGNYGAWTGTLSSGLNAGDDCSAWTVGTVAGTGTHGSVNTAGTGWTDVSSAGCSSGFKLYCLSDFPAVVFTDDWESADVDGWSAAVP